MKTRVEDSHYTIAIDATRRFVEVTPRGLWDDAVVARFLPALLEALTILPRGGCPIGEQVTLVDLSHFIVQPLDIAAMMGSMPGDPRLATRRLATIVAAPLLRMQAKRVNQGVQLFATRAEALAWLTAPDDAIGGPPPHSP